MNNVRRFKSPLKFFVCSLILIATLFTFISCENFLQGADVKEEISKSIEYNNAPSYTINVEALKGTGTVKTPATGEVPPKKVTDVFPIRFEPEDSCKFIKWEAKFQSGKSAADYVEFEDEQSLETKVTLKKAPPSVIIIQPVCPPRLTYTFDLYDPDDPTKIYPKDSSISFVFNKPLPSSCLDPVGGVLPISQESSIKIQPQANENEIISALYFKAPEITDEANNNGKKNTKLIFRSDSSFGYIPVYSSQNNQRMIAVNINKDALWYVNEDYLSPIRVYLDSNITRTFYIGPETSKKTSIKYSVRQKDLKPIGTLKVTSDNITEEADENSHKYSVGKTISLRYSLPEGYSFKKWSFVDSKGNAFSKDDLKLSISVPEEEMTERLIPLNITVDNYMEEEVTVIPEIYDPRKIEIAYDKLENSVLTKVSQINSYAVGKSFNFSYKVPEGYYFYDWAFILKKDENNTQTETSITKDKLELYGLSVSYEADSEKNGYDESSRIAQITVNVNDYSDDLISISPICYQNLKVTNFNLSDTDKTYNRDSNIVLTFSEPIAAACKDKIEIKIPGLPEGKKSTNYFKAAVLSEDKKTVTIEAKRENAEDLIPLLADGTNTVTVTIPASASDVYYQPAEGVKVGLETAKTYSYRIDDKTSNKVTVEYIDESGKGIYKVNNKKLADDTVSYNIGTSVAVSYKLEEGYYFYGWEYKIGDTLSSIEDLAAKGINIEYEEETGSEIGYNISSRLAQVNVSINKYCNDKIAIKPVYYEYLKITDFNNKADQSYDRDRNIQFTFSQPVTGADKISIKVQGQDAKQYFKAAVLSEDKKSVTIEAKREKAEGLIPLLADGTNTVTVTVPASDLYYEPENNVKVGLESDITYSYKINSQTTNKVKVQFLDATGKGTYKVQNVKVSDEQIENYSVGTTISVSYKVDEGYKFNGWQYKIEDTEYTDKDDLQQYGINIEYDEEGALNTGYNTNTRTAQMKVAINGYIATTLSIKPVYYEYLKITDFNNKADQSYERDRNIQFTFSQPVTGADKIGIKVQGQDAKKYFNVAVLSEDKKTVTIEAKREKAEELIPLLADGTNTVTVIVPASDLYYEPESNVKVGLESDITYTYKINSQTTNKVKVQFLDETGKGTYKVQNVKVSDEQIENYSIGTTIALNYKLDEGYYFYGWEYKVGDTLSSKEDLAAKGLNVEYEEETGSEIGYNSSSRLAQVNITINKYCNEQISIKPVYYEYLKITDFNNKADQNYERDRNIQFIFSQPVTGADKIGIKVQGQDAKKYFKAAVLSEDKKIVTIEAKREKIEDLIPLLADGTNTVTVTVPASDLYYEPESNVQVGLESDITYSYKINSQTTNKVKVQFLDESGKGTYKVQNVKVSDEQLENYSVGTTIDVSYKVDEGYKFYGWQYKVGNTEYTNKDDLKQYGINVEYDEEGVVNTGYNANTRTAQIQVAINGYIATTVSIKPVYYEYLKITDFNNKSEQTYERDRDIKLTFSQPVTGADKIGIKVQGQDAKQYFKAAVLSEDKRIVTIEAKRENAEDLIPLLADGTNTVTVTVPASDLYYEPESNVKVGLDSDITYSYKINAQTNKKISINFKDFDEDEAKGTYKVQGNKVTNGQKIEYSLGSSFVITYKLNSGYYFYGWEYTEGETISSKDELKELGIDFVYDEDGDSNGYNSSTRTAQVEVSVNKYTDKVISVRPVYYEYLKVTEFNNNKSDQVYERDSNIEFTFNKNVTSNCSIGDIVKVTGLPADKTAADYFSAMEISGNKLTIKAKNNGVNELLPLLADGTNTITITLPENGVYYEVEADNGNNVHVGLSANETRTFRIGSETSKKTKFKFATPQKDNNTIGNLKIDGKNADDEEHPYSIGQTVSLRYQVPDGYFFYGWRFLNSDNEQIVTEDLKITSSEDGSTENLKVLNITLENYMDKVVVVRPECFENLKVTDFRLNGVTYDENKYYERDSNIEFTFNKTVATTSDIGDIVRVTGLPSGKTVSDYFDAKEIVENKLIIKAKNNGIEELLPLLADGTNTVTLFLSKDNFYYEDQTIDGITTQVHLQSNETRNYHIGSETSRKSTFKFVTPQKDDETIGVLKIDGKNADEESHTYSIGQTVSLRYQVPADYFFYGWKFLNSNNELIEADDLHITTSDEGSTDKLKLLNITVENYMNNVVIVKPECFESLKVTEFKLNDSLFNENNFYNRDSRIEISFNKPVLSNCGIGDIIKISGVSVSNYFETPVIENNKLIISTKHNGVSTLIPLLADGTNTVTVNLPVEKLFYEVESIDETTVNVGLSSNTSYSYKINSQTNDKITVKFAKDNNFSTLLGTLKIDGDAKDSLETECDIGSKVELSYSLSKSERKDYTFSNWKITHTYTDETGLEHIEPANLSNLSALNIRFTQGLISDTNDAVVNGAVLYLDNTISGTLTIQPILNHIPDIQVLLDGEHGKFSPSKGSYTYKLNESNHVEFEPDADYAFVRWQLINTKTNEEYALVSDSNNSTHHSYSFLKKDWNSRYLENEKLDLEFISVSAIGDAELKLRPIVAERPQVISYAPFTGEINRDTTIQVMFDYDMDENSIYYTEQELDTLRDELGIEENSDTGSITVSDSQLTTELLRNTNDDCYGYKKGSDTVYKNISIVNSRSLTNSSGVVENLVQYFEAPAFENPRTLSIRVKRNASNEVDIKKFAQILVTIDKGFFYSTEEGNPVSMNNSKKWVYQVNDETDKDPPNIVDDIEFYIGESLLTPSVNVASINTINSTEIIGADENSTNITIPYYENSGNNAFKLKFTVTDNIGVGSNFTLKCIKEYDEKYDALANPITKSVGIDYDFVSQTIIYEGNCFGLYNQLDSGIYSITEMIVRDGCGNERTVSLIDNDGKKIYICIDKTGPDITSFSFDNTITNERTIKPTWDYSEFPDYNYTTFYFMYYDNGSYKYGNVTSKTVQKGGDTTLTGLKHGTKYRFDVYYYDVKGNRKNKWYYYGYTIPAMPNSVSVARGTDGTSAVVTCEKPTEGNCNSIEISYKTTDSSNWDTSILTMGSANTKSITISGLQNGKEYEFKARSYDSGSGKYSHEYTNINKIKTAPKAPASIATDFNAYTNKGKISWTAPEAGGNYTGYIVYCSTSSDYNTSSTTSYIVTDNSLYHWFEDLVPGTYYYAKVVTYYDDTDNISQPKSKGTWTRPVAPSDLTCKARTDKSITVSWTAPSSGYWSSYLLEYKKSSDSSYSSVYPSRTATSHTINGLEAGVSYDIRLRARYQTSTYSDAVSKTWQLCPNPVTVASPTKISDTSFRINWTAPSGNFDGYNLYISTTEAGLSTATPINLSKTTTEYTKTGCTSRGQYYFKLETYIGTANDDSRLKTDSVAISSSLAFDPVKNLSYTSATSTSFTLTWNNPSMPFDGVEIYRGDTYLTTLSNSYTTYSQSELSVNTQYTYRFVTYKGTGSSRQAAETTVNATTLSEAVSDLTATSNGSTSVNLSWTNPTTSYSSLYVYNVTDNITTYMSSTSVTTYTVTGLTPGKQYTFRVRTRNSVNAACASYTDSVVKTDLATATNISYTSATTSVKLTWTKPAGTYDGIKIYKKLTSDSSYSSTPYATVDNSATSVELTGLTAARTYNLKLETYKSSYTSQSTTTSAYTKTYAPGLSVYSQTSTSLTVKITQGYSNGGTYVYYKKQSDSSYTSVYTGNSSSGAYNYVISGLSPSETYILYASSWYGTSSNSSACSTITRQTSPSAVTNFTATKKSSSSTQVSWTNPTSTYSKLYLYEATTSAGLSSATAIDVTGKTSYTFTGRSSATQYFYKVVSYISDTAKTDSEIKSCITDINPVSVTNYSGQNSTTVKMYWTLPANYDGIRIYRGSTLIKTITSSQMSGYASGSSYYYQDTSLTPNTLYTYSITSYKSVGGTEVTASSGSFSARTMAGYVTSLSASTSSSTSVKLSWVNPTNTNYWVNTVIYSKKDGDSSYKKVTSWSDKTTTSYTVGNLIPGTSYTFIVKTTDANDNENYAYTVTAGTYLATVTNISYTSARESITLYWTKPTGSYDGIKIYKKLSSDSSYPSDPAATINNTTSTSYTISGLSGPNTYNFKIETYKSSYTSQSTTKTCYTKTVAPGLSVSSRTSTSVTLNIVQGYANGGTYVYYKKHSDSSYSSVYTGNSSSGSYTYTISNLASGVKYDIYATSWYGESTNSAASSVTYSVTDPAAPTGVKVIAKEGNVVVQWTKSTGNENYYSISYKKSSDSTWSSTSYLNLGVGATQYELSGLSTGIKYDFKVNSKYYYSSGDNYVSSANNIISADSSIFSYTTPPAPVTNLSIWQDDGMGTVTIKYKANANNNSVDIFVNGVYKAWTTSAGSNTYTYKTLTIPNYKRSGSYTINVRSYHGSNAASLSGNNGGENISASISNETLSKSCTVTVSTNSYYITVNGGDYTGMLASVVAPNSSVNITRNKSYGAFKGSTSKTTTLTTYSIGKFEVLNALFMTVMGNGFSYNSGENTLPVTNINWYAAIAFCNKLSVMQGLEPCYTIGSYDNDYWKNITYNDVPTSNDATWNAATYDFSKNGYHLPTEAQWEFAARGGNTSVADWNYNYSGSNTATAVGWISSNSDGKLHVYGTKTANRLGIYDMTGNAGEWLTDWYNAQPDSTYTNPYVQYNQSTSYGPSRTQAYLMVIDSHYNSSYSVTSRDGLYPYQKKSYYGFRVCRNVARYD